MQDYEIVDDRDDFDVDESSDDAAPPRARTAARRRGVQVLHEDDRLVVYVKPPGVEWTPDEWDPASDEPVRLDDPWPHPGETVFPVNPLDPDESGAAVAARGRATRRALRQQMLGRAMTVVHLALVGRPVRESEGVIESPIPPPDRRHRRGRPDPEAGRPARTEWRVLDGFVGYTLIDCVAPTAWPGQIRRHLQSAGMPLAVDPEFGGADRLMLSSFKTGYRPSRRRPERPLIARLSLHARTVSFDHPHTGAPMRFEAPLPKDFRAALHQLDRFGRLPPPR